jgi:hypothetical protein
MSLDVAYLGDHHVREVAGHRVDRFDFQSGHRQALDEFDAASRWIDGSATRLH